MVEVAAPPETIKAAALVELCKALHRLQVTPAWSLSPPAAVTKLGRPRVVRRLAMPRMPE